MSLHDEIMNLRCKPAGVSVDIYKEGHRDARHAAAQLAIASDARIEALEAALREAIEALSSVYQYGSDTLSGRTNGPDDRTWQRQAVLEMTNRAYLAILKGQP